MQQQQIPGYYKPGISFQYYLFYCRRLEYTLEQPILSQQVLAFAPTRLMLCMACEPTTAQAQYM